MKRMNVLGPMSVAVGLMGCNAISADNSREAKAMDTKAHDVADLKALEDRFMTAFRARDVNAIMQLCVPDNSLVVFDMHPPRQFDGANAYRKDWEDLFNRFSSPLEADISDVNVTAGNDVAYVSSIHHIKGTTKDGKKIDYVVRVTDGFRKIEGKWLIAHTYVSVPVDPGTGMGDMKSNP